MSQYGKPVPGVPDVRAEISRKQEAMGLPPLAPATDTADNERPLTLGEAAAALAPAGETGAIWPAYRFQTPGGAPLLTIWPDGRAELGPGVTLDEASRAFWAYLLATNPLLKQQEDEG